MEEKMAKLEEIEVKFPKEILLAIKENKEEFEKKVRLFTAIKLFEQGKISSGLGAVIVGCTKREFFKLLAENEVNFLDYEKEEWKEEVETSKKFSQPARE